MGDLRPPSTILTLGLLGGRRSADFGHGLINDVVDQRAGSFYQPRNFAEEVSGQMQSIEEHPQPALLHAQRFLGSLQCGACPDVLVEGSARLFESGDVHALCPGTRGEFKRPPGPGVDTGPVVADDDIPVGVVTPQLHPRSVAIDGPVHGGATKVVGRREGLCRKRNEALGRGRARAGGRGRGGTAVTEPPQYPEQGVVEIALRRAYRYQVTDHGRHASGYRSGGGFDLACRCDDLIRVVDVEPVAHGSVLSASQRWAVPNSAASAAR
ncbi:hypothetical protein ACFVUS_27170 [Nocardia sp. NPDC058058]|uniref:hypothetical protein n=1 Tax=Nocardia sp. NPDC058058 TaxID=3346317 RepID=UPI0036D81EB1